MAKMKFKAALVIISSLSAGLKKRSGVLRQGAINKILQRRNGLKF